MVAPIPKASVFSLAVLDLQLFLDGQVASAARSALSLIKKDLAIVTHALVTYQLNYYNFV